MSLDINSVELATNPVPSQAAATFQGHFVPQPLIVSDSKQQAGSSSVHTSTHTRHIYFFSSRRNYSLLPNYSVIWCILCISVHSCAFLFIPIHFCLQRLSGVDQISKEVSPVLFGKILMSLKRVQSSETMYP